MSLEQRIKKILRTGLVIGGCLLGSLVYSNKAEAVTIIEQQITTNVADQLNPAIYGDKIVWEDSRNGNSDIYIYNLTTDTETPICTDPASQYEPAIYDDKIVWEDSRNGGWDIFMYDLTTGIETQITNTGSQYDPAIYGDKIVWQDSRYGNWNIFMYDLGPDGLFGTPDDGGEVQITTDPSWQIRPKIYGTKIVYDDNRNGNFDIYMYDLTTGIESQITTNTAYQSYPAIYQGKIVWQDDRNGNLDIYMYKTPICIATGIQAYPDIYGNYIVWEDWRSGIHIYMYDLGPDGIFGTLDDGGEFQVTTSPGNQYRPAIYGTKIVYDDNRNGNYDIYMATIVEEQIPLKSIVQIATAGIIAGLGALVLGYRRRENEA